jgi:uncharacterized membrane protein YjdF
MTILLLSLSIGLLSVAWGWLFNRYVKTRRMAYFYAALVVMRVEVAVMKERDRARREQEEQ